jgi:hypothetical protein
MKKVTLSLLAVVAITVLTVFSSCKKDETDTIEKWIVGTWELDKYEQQDFKDGVLHSSSESLNQGKVKFNDNGTGDDIGGNFIGGQFEWSNTEKKLTLISGAGTTLYDIEEYSNTDFVFSLTDVNGNDKFVERWYLSK